MDQLVNPHADVPADEPKRAGGRIDGPAAGPIAQAGLRRRPRLRRLLPLAGGLVILLLALQRRRD